MIRIVVAVDVVETDDPTEAYRRVYEAMNGACSVPDDGLSWESTDDWYDDSGESIVTSVIGAARQRVLRMY